MEKMELQIAEIVFNYAQELSRAESSKIYSTMKKIRLPASYSDIKYMQFMCILCIKCDLVTHYE